MCGIWGQVRYEGGRPRAPELDALAHPVRMLSHRGPDGYGWFADEQVALVHTRLSIVDLEGGAQPLSAAGGRWVGIVNGELYDHEAIRRDLEAEGATFATRSDSEVLLNLFALRGPAGLARVSGEFAFLFYDRAEGQLWFGRDPVGVKPLFVEDRPEGITLASEMKAIRPEAPELDRDYVNSFLARCVAPPRTALKGVDHVWPGVAHRLDLRSRRLERVAYARTPFFRERSLRGPEAREALAHELREAVRRRLRADVEVGCYLSGGVDSALVAALAVEAGTRPHAFTVGFTDRDFDESSQAAATARALGLRHSVVTLGSAEFMPSLVRSIVAFENPVANPHGAAKNVLSRLASEHVRVVLSGEGADELFGGYAYLRVRKLAAWARRHRRFVDAVTPNAIGQFADLERSMNARHLDGGSGRYASVVEPYFGGRAPSIFGRVARRRWYRFLTHEDASARVRSVCEGLTVRLSEESGGETPSDWDLDSWIGLRTDLLHYVLANVGDRQEMANSVEGRTPFLDPSVTALAGRIREADLLRGLREKSVLRDIARDVAGGRLPRELGRRGKRPFFAPMRHLYLKANQDMIRDHVRAAEGAAPWLNWPGISRLLDGRPSPASALTPDLTSLRLVLFSLGVLSRHLREEPGSQPRGYRLPRAAEDLLARRVLVT